MVFAIARVAVADGGREKEEGDQNLDHCATRRPGTPVGSEVPSYFEALLLDEIVFGPEERLALLRWCTGSTECR